MATSEYLAPAPVVRRVRGYFAPVNRTAGTPVLFDAAEQGGFGLDTPPAPWVSLGWIDGFARKAGSKTGAVMTGVPAGVLEQVRETVDAQVSLRFLSWTKVTMALAAGSQHMNLLAPAAGAVGSPDGAAGLGAVAIQSGATATFLPMATADIAKFAVGQMVAVDVDYAGQAGFVGTPVAGAFLKAGVVTDVDYVRRVTFNLGTVAAVTSAGLSLVAALPGGVPVTAGAGVMKAQAVVGFVDREGGSFYQEWSALFVMEGSQGERVFFHYPRLQAMGSAAEVGSLLSERKTGTLERMMLSGEFRALPVVDGLDGERVVCYRSYVP